MSREKLGIGPNFISMIANYLGDGLGLLHVLDGHRIVGEVGLLLDGLDGGGATIGVVGGTGAVDIHVVGGVNRNVNVGAALDGSTGRATTTNRHTVDEHHTLHLDSGAILEATGLGLDRGLSNRINRSGRSDGRGSGGEIGGIHV